MKWSHLLWCVYEVSSCALLFTGIPGLKDVLHKAGLNLAAIKNRTSSTLLHLPRTDYLTNRGDLMNCEHKAVMQVGT